MSEVTPSSPSGGPSIPAGETRGDKFRHGKIVKFFPQTKYGFIRDEQGRETYFHLDEVRLLGEKNDRSFITEGAQVGFDVGRTSRGIRVTYLKIY